MRTSSLSSDYESESEECLVPPTLWKRKLLLFGDRDGERYSLTSLSFERAIRPVVAECPLMDITGGGSTMGVGTAGKNSEATVFSTWAWGWEGDGAILVAVGDGINPWQTVVVRGIICGIYAGHD